MTDLLLKLLGVRMEDAVHIANFRLGAMVFHQPVGMQHIRANLRSEIYIEFGGFQLFCDLAFFLQLKFIKP